MWGDVSVPVVTAILDKYLKIHELLSSCPQAKDGIAVGLQGC